MDYLEQILGLFKMDTLEESDKEEVKEKLDIIVKSVISEKVEEFKNEELEKVKEEKVAELDEEYEEYKDTVAKQFSNFIDEVLENEYGDMPEEFKENARIGYVYGDLIESMKLHLSIDEGALNEEAETVLKEARAKIVEQREELDENTDKVLKLTEAKQELEAKVYLMEKCDGMTEPQKKNVMNILEGETNTEVIDRKISYIVESLGGKIDEEDKNSCECPECGYKGGSDKECSATACPECGAEKMKNAKMDEEDENGKGKVDPDENTLEEDDKSPFAQQMEMYLESLKYTKD